MPENRSIQSEAAAASLKSLLKGLAGELRLIMHGSFRFPVYPEWKKAPQLQDDMHLLYIRGGEGRYIMQDGTTVPLVRGSLVIVSNDVEYRAEHNLLDPPLISGFRFGLYLGKAPGRMYKSAPFYSFVAAEDCERYDAMASAVHAAFHSDGGEEIKQLAPLLIHQMIYDMYFALTDRSWMPAESSGEVQRAIAYFKTNAGRKMTVAAAAEHAGISMRALEKQFKAEVGMTPNAYKLMVQMDDAYKALSERGTTVAETAAKLGYSDAFAFSRQFKKYWGLPPIAVKQKGRSRAGTPVTANLRAGSKP